jgi:hypothetical protein
MDDLVETGDIGNTKKGKKLRNSGGLEASNLQVTWSTDQKKEEQATTLLIAEVVKKRLWQRMI